MCLYILILSNNLEDESRLENMKKKKTLLGTKTCRLFFFQRLLLRKLLPAVRRTREHANPLDCKVSIISYYASHVNQFELVQVDSFSSVVLIL